MKFFYLNSSMKKGLNKKLILLLVTLSVGISGSGCSVFPKDEELAAPTLAELAKPEYKQYTAKKGNICRAVFLDGVFVLSKQYDLSFKARSGLLKALNVKEGDLIKRGQLLAELEGNNLENEIKMQQINLEKVQLRYTSLVEEKASELELKTAALDVDAEKLQLQDLQNEYSKITLVSNIDGRVVKCAKINIGDGISMNQTLISIVDVGKMQVECTGDKIKNFKEGTKINVKYKEKDYKGTIVALDGKKTSTDNNGTTTTQYTSMKVDMDNTPEGAAFGETVGLTVEMEKKENVLIIPKKLVKIAGNKGTVLMLENNKRLEKILDLGLDSDTDIEVVNGLKEGDILLEQ